MFSEAVARLGLRSPWDGDIAEATGGDQQLGWLTKAIIARESAWNPSAIRREPNYVCPLTGQRGDASVGLMQVLLCTAQGIDRTMTVERLFDPPTNIAIGTAFLRSLQGQYPILGDVISAYNHGTPWRTAAGYGNQGYVDDVTRYYVWYLNHETGEALPPEDAALAPTGGDAVGSEGAWAGAGVVAGLVLIGGLWLFGRN